MELLVFETTVFPLDCLQFEATKSSVRSLFVNEGAGKGRRAFHHGLEKVLSIIYIVMSITSLIASKTVGGTDFLWFECNHYF